jgi:calcium-dependent protein kinase
LYACVLKLDYKNKDDSVQRGISNLSSVYVKEVNNILSENITISRLFGFCLIFPNEHKKFHCESESEYKKWILALKKVTGYEDLKDIYHIKQKIGNGKFGVVRYCVHKATNREAAMKIIAKKDMADEELEQMRVEIEILKICQHPNIIKLYDVYVNQDYFFISKYNNNLSYGNV